MRRCLSKHLRLTQNWYACHFQASIASMSKEFCEIRNSLSATGSLDAKLVEGAMEFLRQGNQIEHNELIAKTAATFKHCDVLCWLNSQWSALNQLF